MGGLHLKKTILTLTLGMLLGAAATAASPAYGAAKQYVLTLFEKPVIVNGTKYADAANPILNYNGKTYIPLAKIGDLTGVQYKWNAAKNQVEIGGSGSSSSTGSGSAGGGTSTNLGTPATPCESAGQKGCTLNPDTPIEEPTVVGYKGHADSEDPSYQWAVTMKYEKSEFPPLMSEGWISEAMLEEIESVRFNGTTDKNTVEFTNKSGLNKVVYKTVVLPENFNSTKNGDFLIDGIHFKLYEGGVFFSIQDLVAAGIIKG